MMILILIIDLIDFESGMETKRVRMAFHNTIDSISKVSKQKSIKSIQLSASKFLK
jgi:hypothetical protein